MQLFNLNRKNVLKITFKTVINSIVHFHYYYKNGDLKNIYQYRAVISEQSIRVYHIIYDYIITTCYKIKVVLTPIHACLNQQLISKLYLTVYFSYLRYNSFHLNSECVRIKQCAIKNNWVDKAHSTHSVHVDCTVLRFLILVYFV